MMTSKMDLIFEPLVEGFVAETRGYYRNHVSDEMLTALLMWRLSEPWSNGSPKSRAEAILEGDLNAAYDAACCIFERLLEHGARAGGNGHHKAQAFSAAMSRQNVRAVAPPESATLPKP